MKIYTQAKFLLLFLFLSVSVYSTFAQVAITQPTGGQNISNDLSAAAGAPTPGYTSIGDIVIAETNPGDFAAGANLTLTFDRPSTAWQFNPSIGSATKSGPNINIVSTAVTAGRIMVTYTVTGVTDGTNSITISGIQVQSTTKTLGSEAFIFYSTVGSGSVNGMVKGNATTGTKVAPLSKIAGAAASLQVLLPGQINVPGGTTGKSGTAVSQVAGAAFSVVVNAVDYAFNIAAMAPSQAISLTSTNPHINTAGAQNLASGTTTFNVSLNAVSTNNTITATDVTNGSLASNTSSTIRSLVGSFAKLLVLLPGETLDPGSLTGKKNNPSNRVANTATPAVSVYAVDAFWNRVTVTASTYSVSMSTNDPLGVNPANKFLATNGSTSFSITLKTVGQLYNITASSLSDGTKLPYTTVNVNVVAGAFTKLQILLPGETSVPYTTSGKTGTPTAQAAGVPFNVTVNAVDANWNVVTTGADVMVGITNTTATDAATSALPLDATLTAGTGIFSVTLRRAASQSLRATNLTTIPAMAVASSAAVVVNRDVYDKLLITFTGETYLPGTATGKGNTLTTIEANAATTVTVRAVDQYWNLVNNVTETVGLTSTDPNIVFPTNNLPLVAGVKAFGSVRFRTAGNQTITVKNSVESKTYSTGPIDVTAGAYARLVLILPGETYTPGIAAGKSGTPNAQVAGQPFDIKVRAIDASGNIVAVNSTISFTSSGTYIDPYAQLPANAALSNGVLDLNLSATFRVPETRRRITATDLDVASRTSQSPNIIVNIGNFDKLLIVVPGESYAAGHPNGKTGTPSNRVVGAAFNVAVRAVDAAYNTITGVNGAVDLTSNDGFALNASLVNGAKTDFSVVLNTLSYNPATTMLTATLTAGGVTPYTTSGIVVVGASATSNFFRSAVANGDWSNSSSWESSADAISWQPSSLSPGTSSKGITIRSGNVITIVGTSAAIGTGGAMLIENNGQLTITSNRTLTINNGALASNDLVVEGILLNQSGTITINSGALLQFAATGKYQHNFTTSSGVIPTADWAAGSTCEVVRYLDFAGDITGSNQTFSNFVWNTPALTGSPSLLSGFNTTNLTVTSTGSGTLNLASTGGATIITGNYTQTAGNVIANKTSGTQSLFVAGNFLVNGGSFALGNGTVNVTFNGTSAQSLSNSGAAIEFQNIAFFGSGTKTLSSGSFSLATTGVLTMNPNTTLDANGNLTILSNASSSGTIASIPSSSEIKGNVTVQRYITGGTTNHRTYRMLSSPIYDNGASGDRKYSFLQFNDDMIISGGAGFYPTPNNTPSAWTYDASVVGDKYIPIPNLNTSIPVGQGAYLFYRGDKVNNLENKVTPPYAIPESIAMTFTGVLNQQSVGLSLQTGFNLVGNPYASSIDWNSAGVVKTNLQNNIIRIWDPVSRNYATYNGDTGVPSGMDNIIPAGQGFFVQSNAGGSLGFEESAKIGSQPLQLLMSVPVGQDLTLHKIGTSGAALMAGPSQNITATPRTEVRLALKKSDLTYKVETAVILQQGRNADYQLGDDVNYITSAGEYGTKVFLSSFSSNNNKLAINYLPEVGVTSQVKIDLDSRNADGNYSLQVNIKDLPAGYLAKLNDSFLSTSNVVQDGDIHSFSITASQPASVGADRFSLSFEAPTTLPVTYNSFNVAKVSEGVLVKWSTQTETNNNRFEVQRASDDKAFVKLHTELAKGNNSSYSFIDKNPLLGNNYYRLVQIDNDNKQTPNVPQVINYTGELNGGNDIVSVFPNPVVAKFTVKYNGALKANQQTLRIVNTTGQVLLTKTVNKAELINGYDINIPSYATGVYVVEVYESGNQRIGQVKLIKR